MTNDDKEDYSIIPDHPDAESANNLPPQEAGDERSQFNAAPGYAAERSLPDAYELALAVLGSKTLEEAQTHAEAMKQSWHNWWASC